MTWPRRAATACLLALVAIALPLSNARAERLEQRPAVQGSTGDGKELGRLFDDIFGDSNSGPVLKAYEPTGYDYMQILPERQRSLGIFRSRGYGLVGEPALNAYVNRVLQRLLEHAPEKPIPAQAYVVADRTFGADAAPDGALFVNLGMVRDLESEDELAFTLAHELSHVILRHHGSDWYVHAERRALVGMKLAGELVGQVQQLAGTSLPGSRDLQTAILIGTLVYEFSDIAVAPFFTREEEDQADIFGLDLMIAAGYNMTAATKVLEKIDAWEKQQAANKPVKSEAEREAEMTEAFRTRGLAGAIEAMTSALGDAFRDVKDELKTEHYPAAERNATVQNYMLRHYLKDVPPPVTELAWNEKSSDAASIRGLFANYDAANNARTALAENKIGKAEAEASKAVSGHTKHDAFTRLAFYEVRSSQGNKALARRNLEIALESPEPSYMLYRTLLDDAMARGDWGEALSSVEAARSRLADTPLLLPYRIEIYRNTGRQNETTPLLIECSADHPELEEDCQLAAGQSYTPASGLLPAAGFVPQ